MELTFLGTASAYPTPTRCVSCTALRYNVSNHDWIWLFDCGEGSQIQLMKSSLKPGKISKIFITHLHGDHVYGLPGLLCTISQNNQRTEPVEIYGPLGLRKYLIVNLALSRAEMGFNFVVHELQTIPEQMPEVNWTIKTSEESCHPNEDPGKIINCDENLVWTVFSDAHFLVEAVWVKHRVPCFAYVVKEHDRPGRLDVEKLKEMGVPSGPLYGRLKAGETITLDSGIQIKPDDVMGEALKGRTVAIGGDSCDSSELMKVAFGADVLIHEATLENALQERCIENGHSTPGMTAKLAQRLEVKQLVLTHFSQRYKPISSSPKAGEESVHKLLVEAQEVIGENSVFIAEDLLTFTVIKQHASVSRFM